MTLATTPTRDLEEGVVTLDPVSWDDYERALLQYADRHVRITYDRGRMTIMSPLPIHERLKRLVGRFVETASLELDIPCASLGSTTWKRKDRLKGLEPDECYYIQHEPQISARTDIDLSNDPPPDLALEVDITHHPLDRRSIYASLGVPELWMLDGREVRFLKLGSDGQYRPIGRSEAIPQLTPEDINRFLAIFRQSSEPKTMKAFRDWVRSLAVG